MQRRFFVSLAAAALFAFASAAPAAAQNVREVRVSYADLDLVHGAGADVLISRIQRAARIACDDRPGRMSLQERTSAHRCAAEAADAAIAQVGGIALTQRYAERTGRRVPSVTVAAAN